MRGIKESFIHFFIVRGILYILIDNNIIPIVKNFNRPEGNLKHHVFFLCPSIALIKWINGLKTSYNKEMSVHELIDAPYSRPKLRLGKFYY